MSRAGNDRRHSAQIRRHALDEEELFADPRVVRAAAHREVLAAMARQQLHTGPIGLAVGGEGVEVSTQLGQPACEAVAVEDANFFGHRGVNLRALVRAMLSNFESGNARQGASTITQQVVKNEYLGGIERDGRYKILQARYAALLEKQVSKKQILERYLNTLGTIASISPLMGLFGTVIGMIEIFGANSPTGTNPQQLAHGISVALYNTGLGIFIAVPAMIMFRYFRGAVEGFVVEMERAASRLVELTHSAGRSGSQ